MKAKRLLVFLLSLGMVQAISAQENVEFRLEWSAQSLFIQYDQIGSGNFFGQYISKKVFNYSTSISGFWEWNDHWEVGLGLGFSNRDFYGTCYCEFCDKAPGPELYTRRRTLDVPMQGRVYWRKPVKKFRPFFSIGIIHELPLHFDQDGEGSFGFSTPQYSLGVTLALGATLQLSPQFALLFTGGMTEHKYLQVSNTAIRPVRQKTIGLDAFTLGLGVRYMGGSQS